MTTAAVQLFALRTYKDEKTYDEISIGIRDCKSAEEIKNALAKIASTMCEGYNCVMKNCGKKAVNAFGSARMNATGTVFDPVFHSLPVCGDKSHVK